MAARQMWARLALSGESFHDVARKIGINPKFGTVARWLYGDRPPIRRAHLDALKEHYGVDPKDWEVLSPGFELPSRSEPAAAPTAAGTEG